jgi:hypothetical protein
MKAKHLLTFQTSWYSLVNYDFLIYLKIDSNINEGPQDINNSETSIITNNDNSSSLINDTIQDPVISNSTNDT